MLYIQVICPIDNVQMDMMIVKLAVKSTLTVECYNEVKLH